MVVIDTERLRLRRWRPDDLEALAEMNADAEVMRHIGDGLALSQAQSGELLRRIRGHWDEHGFGLWALELRGHRALVGFAGLARPLTVPELAGSVEIGWRLRRDAWGQGLATEAATAALAYAWHPLGLREVVSIIHPDNERSIGVARRLGLRPRGRARRADGRAVLVYGAPNPGVSGTAMRPATGGKGSARPS